MACATVPPPPAPHDPAAAIHLPKTGPIHVVVLGDTGKGTGDQKRVKEAVRAHCADVRCDLGLLLGDNIYEHGIASVDDPRFEVLGTYDDLGVPFLVVLGNHDYGAPWGVSPFGGMGFEENRAEAQITRISTTKNLYLPARHWRLDLGRVEFVGLDTQSVFWTDAPSLAGALHVDDDVASQERDLLRWSLSSTAPLRVALGHHPYRSAGPHGDAGHSDGVPQGLVFSTEHIRQLLDEHVLGHFALYLSGHDHGLQDAGDERGTALFISGGGAEHKPQKDPGHVPFAVEKIGFITLTIDEQSRVLVQIWALDDAGDDVKMVHERTVDP
jgi:hypothetical protein